MAQTNAVSGYPAEIDILDPAAYPADPDPGALKHSKISDALRKVQDELGTTPSGAAPTVRQAIDAKADAAATQTALDAKAPLRLTRNTQIGTAYTLALTDEAKVVEVNNASANTVTVPTNATVAFPVGAVVLLRQYGAGQVNVAAATGVSVRSRGDVKKLAGQYAEASLTKRGTDEWILSGDITA